MKILLKDESGNRIRDQKVDIEISFRISESTNLNKICATNQKGVLMLSDNYEGEKVRFQCDGFSSQWKEAKHGAVFELDQKQVGEGMGGIGGLGGGREGR
jgi:hypothetical protein